MVLVAPVLVGAAAVQLSIGVVARPDQRLAFWVWLAALMAVSIVASIAAHRMLRRFAPLAVLFKMSLVFPDEAPSRFGTVLRNGTTRKLSERLIGPEQAAAENLIALLAQLGRHDRLTRGHTERVRAYSMMLGEQIGLSRADLDKLNWAALIHDIGKLDVPEALLNKPGRPTDDEWAVLRAHPAASAKYVEPLREWLGVWALAATQHHERYDGGGYPLGLAGDEISLAGRIVAIADAYDVMTAPRSYKPPLPAAQARAELTRSSGTQFDPQLVRSFLEISLGRMRAIPGPLGWLAVLPDMIRVPVTTILSTATGAVASAAVTAAAATAFVVAPDQPAHASARTAAIATSEHTASSSTTDPITTTTVIDTVAVPSTDVVPPATVPPVSTVAVSNNDLLADAPTTAEPATTSTATSDGSPPSSPTPTSTAPPTTSSPQPAAPPSATPATSSPATTTTAAGPTTAPVPTTPAVTSPPTSPAVITLPPTTPPPTTLPPTTVPATTAPPLLNLSNDLATARVNKSVTIHVLQNDRFDGSTVDLSTLEIVTPPTLGTARVVGENISYNASGNLGTDSLTYRVCSLAGSCQQATVTIAITS